MAGSILALKGSADAGTGAGTQGQHLLSAVVEILTGAGTVSWEMHPLKEGEPASKASVSVELDVEHISPQQVEAIEVFNRLPVPTEMRPAAISPARSTQVARLVGAACRMPVSRRHVSSAAVCTGHVPACLLAPCFCCCFLRSDHRLRLQFSAEALQRGDPGGARRHHHTGRSR